MNIIRIAKQLEYFQQYQQRLGRLVGDAEAQQLVSQGLTLITLGGNDFVNNYFLIPYSVRSREFSLPDYIKYIISEYKKVLARLHELGARRVLVTGTGPLGCVPAELAQRSRNGNCDVELQRAAALFNPQLVEIINQLNQEIGSNVFVFANAFDMHMDYISNPTAYGFVTSKVACCGQGPYNGIGLCTLASNLCPNRNLYAFWDAYHPTEKASRIIVSRMLSGSGELMHPLNLSSILAMDAQN
ncbi:GDSL esterase/lipase [Acorus calamus]|uniref:GDSL esterase/lipase n=1 Tax=Acorus calamus TaxID=4465 RepID=A0AAV9EJU3_ACOCL|nr:GDSL esterase/lipase [Acorus calamus]